ncbi:MAG: hypothetical protein IPP77_00750 [Bacteroidetes bacterium]|nr:hypothetical protein [Bacteroidota bacterium]
MDDQLAADIETILSKYPGKTKLRFKFLDYDEGLEVSLNASSKSIELSNELLKELDQKHIGYSLN